MHDPWDEHMIALHRILRYVQGTLGVDVLTPVVILPVTIFFWVTIWSLGLLSDTLRCLKYSVEAEYHVVANVNSKTCWIRNLLLELYCPLPTATLIYCDNVSVVYLSGNPVYHQRTKHIEMDIHFVHKKV